MYNRISLKESGIGLGSWLGVDSRCFRELCTFWLGEGRGGLVYIEGIRLRTGIRCFRGAEDFGYLVGREGCIRAKACLYYSSVPVMVKV